MARTNTKTDLTVIVPAWNLDAELREAVKGIKAQRVPCRIIIVDNASDTPLPKIAGVEYLKLPHRMTVGAARNEALRTVKTEYVFFADADDLILPHTFSTLRGALERHPEAVAAAGREVLWNPNTGTKVPSDWPFSYTERLQRHRLGFALMNTLRNIFPIAGYVVHRTAAVQRCGGFADMNYAEDWCLGVPLAYQGRVLLTDHPGRLYRLVGERPRLSSQAKGSVTLRWQAQREVRKRLRRTPGIPMWVKVVSPLLVIPHLGFLIVDLVRTRR